MDFLSAMVNSNWDNHDIYRSLLLFQIDSSDRRVYQKQERGRLNIFLECDCVETMDFHFHTVDDSNEHNFIDSGDNLTCKARILLVENFDIDDKII